MEEFVEAHRELLAADACVWEGSGVTWEGPPMVPLGVKGLLYVELTCNTISHDAHSSYGTVLPNAAWRLVWALSTIKGPDERVMIEGFYDDVRAADAGRARGDRGDAGRGSGDAEGVRHRRVPWRA